MSHSHCAFLLWLAPFLVGWPPASPEQDPACKACRGLGSLPCAEHGKEDLAGERGVLYCSVVDGCAACGGTGLLPCPKCDKGTAEAELALRRQQVAERRVELAALDQAMQRPLRKAESAHFVLVWEMTDMKVGKKRLSEHQMLHVTLERLESLYDEYVQLLRLTDLAFRKKIRVFVWQLPSEHQRGSLAFCGLYAPRGTKLMGVDPNYSVCASLSFFRDDAALHRNLVHCVTHLLFSHEEPAAWVGNLKCGWVDEGLAHYFEHRSFGTCDNYCYEEQNTVFDYKGGNFKPALRKALESGQAPALLGVMHKNSTDLAPAEHALSLAMVEYLVDLDALKFQQFGRKLRAKTDVKDALQQVFGLNPFQFEEQLAAWVLTNYPQEK